MNVCVVYRGDGDMLVCLANSMELGIMCATYSLVWIILRLNFYCYSFISLLYFIMTIVIIIFIIVDAVVVLNVIGI